MIISDKSGSLWQFKRDEVPAHNADLNVNNSESFKYKAALIRKTKGDVDNTISAVKDTKIVVPLKYLSKFWRSLKMSLIIYKVQLELNWIEDCILSGIRGSSKFKIIDAKLHVLIATFSTEDNVNVTKHLSKVFKRYVYWNSYQTKPAKVIEKGKNIYELLNASFQSIRRLFVLAFVIAVGAGNDETDIKNNIKYFLPRGEIKNYNLLIDRRNIYGQPINDLIKHYDGVRKVSIG